MNRRIRTALAVLCAAVTVLTACSSENSSSDGESRASSQTENAVSESETESAAESTADKPRQINNVRAEKGHGGYDKLTLSGNREDTLVTTDFCYIESEKYVILMEKDLKIPGDLSARLDEVVDQLEKSIGLRYDPDSYDYSHRTDPCTALYGINPWEGFDFGRRMPVYLVVDRSDEGLISAADETHAVICLYELFSDEVWNSVPSYRDNEFRRSDHIEYGVFAHELTHTITGRYAILSKILCEGSASYYSYKAIKELARKSEDMQKSLEDLMNEDVTMSEKVTASNAERIFLSDFADLDTEDRGEEYTFGKYLWKYLDETFGTEKTAQVFERFKELEQQNGLEGYVTDNPIVAEYGKALKEHFGEDVFEKFGARFPKI